MKNLILTIVLFTISIFMHAQIDRVVPLFDRPETQDGTYFKDIDSDLEKLVGKWSVTKNGHSIILELKVLYMERTQINPNLVFFEDVLYGEYQYSKNNITLSNSLPVKELDGINFPAIAGNLITTNSEKMPECPFCGTDTRWIILDFYEPENPHLQGRMRIAHFNQNGTEKLQVLITNTLNENNMVGFSGQKELKIPEGLYTFEKVN